MSILSLRLPNSLHKAIKQLAEKEEVSINQFITVAVAEKLSSLTTVDYLKERAARANEHTFMSLLNSAPDQVPDEWDKL